MSNIFKTKFFSNKKVQLATVLVLSLIVLLIAFGGNTEMGDGSPKPDATNTSNYEQSYEETIEKRIISIVNSINGVSEASAFVYTKNSIEIIYGEDVETKTSGAKQDIISETKSIAYSKDGSKTTAVIIKKEYPEIEGVLVVAKGLDDEKKRIMIINALASVLGINISSIEVLAG